MARPAAAELTERELEIMQHFWSSGEHSVADVQASLEAEGRTLAYTTVATLVRILVEKGFLKQTSDKRPHSFKARRSFNDVSSRMVQDLVRRLFGGSHEALMLHLMEDQTLSEADRKRLREIAKEES
jgi:predicted transcriptional regulator